MATLEKMSTSVRPEVAERIRTAVYGADESTPATATISASSYIAYLIDYAFDVMDGKTAKEAAAANEAADLIRATAQSVDLVLDRLTDGDGKSEIAGVREAAQGIETVAKEIKSRMVEPRFMLAACAVIGAVSGIVGALVGAVL